MILNTLCMHIKRAVNDDADNMHNSLCMLDGEGGRERERNICEMKSVSLVLTNYDSSGVGFASGLKKDRAPSDSP